MARTLPVFAVLCLLLAPAGSQADDAAATVAGKPAAGMGRLTGTVEVGPELSTRKIKFHLYPDLVKSTDMPGVPSSPSPQEEVQNVVVYFVAADIPAPARTTDPAPVTMKQEGLAFVPHVIAIQKGTTVEFPNSDPIFHNVFSLSRKASFDLGRYPMGASKSVRFDEPGLVKVFCHIHSDMNGLVMVLDNPFFARPDASGRFEIDRVPPGTYRVVAWHERARPLETTIRIEPGHTSRLDFKIPLNEATGG